MRILKNIRLVSCETQRRLRMRRSLFVMSIRGLCHIVMPRASSVLPSCGHFTRLEKDHASKLQGLSRRMQMPEIGGVRARLSETIKRMKDAEAFIKKRALNRCDFPFDPTQVWYGEYSSRISVLVGSSTRHQPRLLSCNIMGMVQGVLSLCGFGPEFLDPAGKVVSNL